MGARERQIETVPGPTTHTPRILGLGGTLRPDSSSERALRVSLDAAADAGAETVLIDARGLDFPMYDPRREPQPPASEAFLREVARADGFLISTPGYHGGYSGLLKNALDYVEELRTNDPPYFHDRAVGCIVCAHGWQATTTTLVALRQVAHALRGWPTPLGVAINSMTEIRPDGSMADGVEERLRILGEQVTEFARWQQSARVGA